MATEKEREEKEKAERLARQQEFLVKEPDFSHLSEQTTMAVSEEDLLKGNLELLEQQRNIENIKPMKGGGTADYSRPEDVKDAPEYNKRLYKAMYFEETYPGKWGTMLDQWWHKPPGDQGFEFDPESLLNTKYEPYISNFNGMKSEAQVQWQKDVIDLSLYRREIIAQSNFVDSLIASFIVNIPTLGVLNKSMTPLSPYLEKASDIIGINKIANPFLKIVAKAFAGAAAFSIPYEGGLKIFSPTETWEEAGLRATFSTLLGGLLTSTFNASNSAFRRSKITPEMREGFKRDINEMVDITNLEGTTIHDVPYEDKPLIRLFDTMTSKSEEMFKLNITKQKKPEIKPKLSPEEALQEEAMLKESFDLIRKRGINYKDTKVPDIHHKNESIAESIGQKIAFTAGTKTDFNRPQYLKDQILSIIDTPITQEGNWGEVSNQVPVNILSRIGIANIRNPTKDAWDNSYNMYLKEGGRMGLPDFNYQLSLAGINNDIHPGGNEIISESSRGLRANIYEPFQAVQKAYEYLPYSLTDAKFAKKYNESYMPRIYKFDAIENNVPEMANVLHDMLKRNIVSNNETIQSYQRYIEDLQYINNHEVPMTFEEGAEPSIDPRKDPSVNDHEIEHTLEVSAKRFYAEKSLLEKELDSIHNNALYNPNSENKKTREDIDKIQDKLEFIEERKDEEPFQIKISIKDLVDRIDDLQKFSSDLEVNGHMKAYEMVDTMLSRFKKGESAAVKSTMSFNSAGKERVFDVPHKELMPFVIQDAREVVMRTTDRVVRQLMTFAKTGTIGEFKETWQSRIINKETQLQKMEALGHPQKEVWIRRQYLYTGIDLEKQATKIHLASQDVLGTGFHRNHIAERISDDFIAKKIFNAKYITNLNNLKRFIANWVEEDLQKTLKPFVGAELTPKLKGNQLKKLLNKIQTQNLEDIKNVEYNYLHVLNGGVPNHVLGETFKKISMGVRAYSASLMLGRMVLSALPEIATITLTSGFRRHGRVLKRMLMRHGQNMSKKTLQRLDRACGEILDELGTQDLRDSVNVFSSQDTTTKTSRWVMRKMAKWSLMESFDNFRQRIALNVVTENILDLTKKMVLGSASELETGDVRAISIDKKMAYRIQREYLRHRTPRKEGGFKPNLDKWDYMTEFEFMHAAEYGVSRSDINPRATDVPIAYNNDLYKLALQFTSWMFPAVYKILLSGMQRDFTNFMATFMIMFAISFIKNWAIRRLDNLTKREEEQEEDDLFWDSVKAAYDTGVTGFLLDAPIKGFGAIAGSEFSRYLTGSSQGFKKGMGPSLNNFFNSIVPSSRPANNILHLIGSSIANRPYSAYDLHLARKLMPGQNLLGLSSLIDMGENHLVDSWDLQRRKKR